jgi:hypothetical protein
VKSCSSAISTLFEAAPVVQHDEFAGSQAAPPYCGAVVSSKQYCIADLFLSDADRTAVCRTPKFVLNTSFSVRTSGPIGGTRTAAPAPVSG